MAGWAAILYLLVLSYQKGDTPAQLWSTIGDLLTWVQTAAALEIVHSGKLHFLFY